MKHIAKIILSVIALTLAISVCSCAHMETITRDIPRAVELATKISELAKMSDTEAALAEAEQYIHPRSGLDKDKIVELIKNNEAIKSLKLDDATNRTISVGKIATPEYKGYNEELGGNIYVVKTVVTVAGQSLNVTVQLLSDDAKMGLYSFDITSGN